MIQFNVVKIVGEIKIDRESRQRSSKHGRNLVNPLINEKGARWIMNKTVFYIKRNF